MIRLALIGCGSHSRGNHATPLSRYAHEHPDDVDLVAACDLDIKRAEGFCQRFGFKKAYDDMDKMLDNEQIDGCIAVMPIENTSEVAIKLLSRKMPCVIEKPMGVSIDQVRHLADVTKTTGTPHMVSVNRRFNPYINKAIEWARGKGPISFVRGAMVRNRRREPVFIWGTAIHSVDAFRFIGGDVEDFDWRMFDGKGLSARWYEITLNFASGCIGHLDILPTGGVHEESYELFGEGFRAIVHTEGSKPSSLQCWYEGQCELDIVSPESEPYDVMIGPYNEVIEFVKALREKTPLKPSVEDVLPSLEICSEIATTLGVL